MFEVRALFVIAVGVPPWMKVDVPAARVAIAVEGFGLVPLYTR
jgi:hypothetical protein